MRTTSSNESRTWSGRIREEERQLPGPISSRGHVGLSVILAKDSAIKQQNARIRRMISEIIPPAMRETTKETAAEIMVAMVDKDCLDKAIEAELLRNKTLRG